MSGDGGCVCTRTNKLLKVYWLEGDALEAAARWAKSGQPMFHYRCTRCGDWHLSPKPPIPHVHCYECGKESYECRRDAREMARRLCAQGQRRLYVYVCPEGGYWRRDGRWVVPWHLTKKPVRGCAKMNQYGRDGAVFANRR